MLNSGLPPGQWAGELRNGRRGVGGAGWEGARRGGPRVYNADKRRVWTVGWDRSVSKANAISVQRTYTGEPVLEPLHSLAKPGRGLRVLGTSGTQGYVKSHCTHLEAGWIP